MTMRFLLAITAAISSSAQAVSSQGAKAELPRVYLDTKYPAVTRKIPVPAGSNLQKALNAARAGDELVLAAGASYVGNFTWNRCLAGYVIVTGPKGPAEGVRLTPAIAAASQYPRLISPTTLPAVLATNGGCRLRLSRVEITATAQSSTVSHNEGLVRLGDGENTLDWKPRGAPDIENKLRRYVILKRCHEGQCTDSSLNAAGFAVWTLVDVDGVSILLHQR